MDPGAVLQALLGLAEPLAPARWVYEQYDYTVAGEHRRRAGPGRGRPAHQGHDQGARRRDRRATPRSARSTRGSARRCRVAEAARNVVDHRRPAAGRHELPQLRRPDAAGGVLAAERGASAASATPAARSELPVTGGNVSLYNEAPGSAHRADARDRRRRAARRRRDARRAGVPRPTATRSCWSWARRRRASPAASTRGWPARPPRTVRRRSTSRASAASRRSSARRSTRGLVEAAQDVAGGGLAVALAEMAIWGGRGARLRLPVGDSPAVELFGESPSRLRRRGRRRATSRRSMLLARQHGLPVDELGSTGGDRLVIELAGEGATGAAEERGAGSPTRSTSPVADLRHAWEHGLPGRSAGRPRRTQRGRALMCGVVGVVLPGSGHEAAALAAPRLFALQHRGQESAGLGGQRRRAPDGLQGPRLVSQVLDERRLPSLPRRPRRSPTAATRRPARRSGRTPSPRSGSARAARSRSATTATSSTRASCWPSSPGGRGRLAATHRHGAADRAARRRARRRHWSTRCARVLPRVRGAYSLVSSTSSGSSACATRTASGRWCSGGSPVDRRRQPSGRACGATTPRGWVLASETAALDILGAEFVRDVEPGEIVVLEPGREPGLGPLRRRRGPRCACSSSSTSPAPTRTWRAATCTRRGGGWGCSSRASTRSSRPRDARARHRRAGRGRVSRRRRASRIARAWSATGTAGRTFIQPSQAMRQRGVNVKLSPLREVGPRPAAGRRRRLDRARHDDPADRRRCCGEAGAARGPRPDQRAAHLPPLLLRHRHADRDGAHRGDPLGRGDPRVHRRRLARLPLDPGRARRARPAVRAVLLRVLRRQLPGARPVRRGQPQVHARDRARGAGAADERSGRTCTRVPTPGPASTSRPASARWSLHARRGRGDAGGPRCSAASAGSAAASRSRRATASRCIVSATDGVGTKTAIAAALGRFDTIGIDLVAMCADDVVCTGAEPLFFLDYIAVGRLDPRAVAELVGGVAGGCGRPAARSSAARRPSIRA